MQIWFVFFLDFCVEHRPIYRLCSVLNNGYIKAIETSII